jgi:aspartyl aminopeptidase
VLDDLLAYLHASPTPFHAVAEARRRLDAVGFRPLAEAEPWDRLAPGAYHVTTSETNLIAFVVPADAAARARFRIVGAHTDSPNLRLKPNAEYTAEGYAQLGVEVYGGALLNSWLDRDLGWPGGSSRAVALRVTSHLVRVDRPVARVPPHDPPDREVNDKGLCSTARSPGAGVRAGGRRPRLPRGWPRRPGRADASRTELMRTIRRAHPGGPAGEARRASTTWRWPTRPPGAAAAGPDLAAIPVIALFDHEEVGSASAAGAGSAVLPRVLERLIGDREAFHQACARSSCISADMAHAVHPNYAGRHEPRHKPVLNGGPVIKTNSQQRYATTSATALMFAELCRAEGVPVQHYAHRTDLPCGSTIGPITSTLLGIATVDVGNPMLSMHSAREMAGSQDPALMTRVLTRYLGGQAPGSQQPGI